MTTEKVDIQVCTRYVVGDVINLAVNSTGISFVRESAGGVYYPDTVATFLSVRVFRCVNKRNGRVINGDLQMWYKVTAAANVMGKYTLVSRDMTQAFTVEGEQALPIAKAMHALDNPERGYIRCLEVDGTYYINEVTEQGDF